MRIVGCLLYLAMTQLNIAYLVHIFNPFVHNPKIPQLIVVVRIIRYVKGNLISGSFFPTKNDCRTIVAYSYSC